MAVSLLQSFRELAVFYNRATETAEQPIASLPSEPSEGSGEKADPLEVVERLASLGIDRGSIRLDSDGNIHLPVTDYIEKAPDMPEPYAYKGGAARWLLAKAIGQSPHLPPRDLDVFRMGDHPERSYDDYTVAMQFMPEDISHGSEVDVYQANSQYFSTRDISLNEVYATASEIVASPQCIADTLDRIIRLSDYEYKRFDGPGHKMVAKLLRLQSQYEMESGKKWNLHDDDRFVSDYRGNQSLDFSCEHQDRAYLSNRTTAFFMAVQLNRAVQVGETYANAYVAKLLAFGHIPPRYNTIDTAWEYLNSLIDRDVSFPHLTAVIDRERNKGKRLETLYRIQEEHENTRGAGRSR